MILSSYISCVDFKVMENLLRGKVEFCPLTDGQIELENDPTFTEKKEKHILWFLLICRYSYHIVLQLFSGGMQWGEVVE